MKFKSINLAIGLSLALAFASCSAPVHAQGPGAVTTTDKKAQKLYEEAVKCMDARKYPCVEDQLGKAINRDPNFMEAHNLLAIAYVEQEKNDLAVAELKKCIELNPRFSAYNYFMLAKIQMSRGEYGDAKKAYQAYVTFPAASAENKAIAQQDIANCDFAIEAMKHPKPFKLVNMGPNINTASDEYFPSITADGLLFLFTRDIKDSQSPYGHQEDFFVSLKNGVEWGPSYSIGAPINTIDNEGAPSVTADGQLVIFTACETYGDYGMGRQGYGSCDIFYSQRYGEKWTKPQNLGPKINSNNWESQPSFSSDGRTLYFVRGSNNKDGTKNQDIYIAQLTEEGEWGAAVKLSDKVNTPGREESVFIHPDNQTLYFSSDGHTGMGGLDIFMSKRQPDGEWGEPVNLGYPINTAGDENSILVGPDGKLAYFASNRAGGQGGLDMYQFELPQEDRPEQITYMKGKVYDSKTKKPLAAQFELIDLKTAKTVMLSTSNPGNGEFLVTLPANRDYALNVSRPGYAFYSDNFSMTGGADINKPFMKDVPLQPIDTGTIVVLKNIFFETGKYNLKDESKGELKKVIDFMVFNKNLKIELRGHTDNVGDDKSNLLLSQNRAKAVYDYLITNGIPKERLAYKGYGETIPIADNNTPEGRERNRRTEFKVIGK
jgi:outer membrane protein OmpA-like peptidoglycan-associated protein/tetratricopeptide (TPR) repeat protein